MARIDHVAFECDDPDTVAAFLERMFGARVVRAEGHPVMAYVGNTGSRCTDGAVRATTRESG